MTQLTRTTVDHDKAGDLETVSFETNDGFVELGRFKSGDVYLEFGLEEVSPDKMADLLNEVADDEHMDMDALEVAFSMVEDACSDDNNYGKAEDDDSDGKEWDDGDVIHTLDDGTEVRVGDKVKCTENSHYMITGKEGNHLATKRDPTDAWAIDLRSLERHVRQHGFAGRASA